MNLLTTLKHFELLIYSQFIWGQVFIPSSDHIKSRAARKCSCCCNLIGDLHLCIYFLNLKPDQTFNIQLILGYRFNSLPPTPINIMLNCCRHMKEMLPVLLEFNFY